MLNKIKKIYRYFPTRISSPLIKTFKLAPVFSKNHWNKVFDVSLEDDAEVTINDINELLNSFSNNFQHSTFYSNLAYNRFKKSPTLEGLKTVPFIDSSVVREQFEFIVNKHIPGYYTSTGGTGGSPLKLFLSNESYFLDRAYVFYAWSTLGYKRGSKKLTLRGVNLGNTLTEFNPLNNELNVNLFLLNKNNISEVVNEVNKFSPDFGHGYPSAWFNLSHLMKENYLKLNESMSGIYFASESVDKNKRDKIEQFFNVKVRSTYSSSERSWFSYELPDEKNIYKIMHRYGLIEVIKENGEKAEIGEFGEIVCTGFINKGLPLLRYKTGDFAVVHKIKNNIVTHIKDIKGRWGKDYILDKEGTKIYTTSINLHSNDQYNFKYIQLFQEKAGVLKIRLVPFSKTGMIFANKIENEFKNKLPLIDVSIDIVEFDDLYKTHRSKIPYLVKE